MARLIGVAALFTGAGLLVLENLPVGRLFVTTTARQRRNAD